MLHGIKIPQKVWFFPLHGLTLHPFNEKQKHQLNMKTIVFLLWRIRSFLAAIIRSAKKTAVRVMLRREVTDCTAGRQAAQTGRMRPYAGHLLPFLKYAPYTARDGIRR
jgi:hypothetical protein